MAAIVQMFTEWTIQVPDKVTDRTDVEAMHGQFSLHSLRQDTLMMHFSALEIELRRRRED